MSAGRVTGIGGQAFPAGDPGRLAARPAGHPGIRSGRPRMPAAGGTVRAPFPGGPDRFAADRRHRRKLGVAGRDRAGGIRGPEGNRAEPWVRPA